jgi:hypothetical protein
MHAGMQLCSSIQVPGIVLSQNVGAVRLWPLPPRAARRRRRCRRRRAPPRARAAARRRRLAAGCGGGSWRA